jgi:dTDP-3-amino-3,4,6-trideoxy-alpha-D-glucose transaminase
VWHLFALRVPEGRRAEFRGHLAGAEIESGVHYPTLIPDQRALDGVAHEIAGDLPVARDFAANQVSLPIHPFLEDEEVERVIAACNSWKPA